MNSIKKKNVTATILFLFTALNTAHANEVQILSADFHDNGEKHWSVSVTLKHNDTGWDHYADNWRIVDNNGNLLGNRVLMHPHVSEQPFTRGLGDVKIPADIKTVYIEAHDKVHGWTANRLKVDL